MNPTEAANILRRMHRDSPPQEKSTPIHLFGIKYAQELASLSTREVVVPAGLAPTYATEVPKGRRLAKYVVLKDGA